MKVIKTWFQLITLLLMVSLVFTACGQSNTTGTTNGSSSSGEQPAAGGGASPAPAPAPTPEAPKELKKVLISVPAKSLVFLPNYLGQEKGFYKEVGIDLQIEVMKAQAAVAAALSGEVPYTGSLGSSLRAVVTGGAELKVIGVMLDNLAFSLFTSSDIKALSDLKGKTVMVTSTGATDHYAYKQMMISGNLDPDKTANVVSSSTTANSFQSLLNGAAQGAMLSPPFSQMAEQKGYVRLGDAIDVLERGNSGISVSTKYLNENKDEVTRFLQATLKSMDFIRENREETIQFIQKFWELEPALAEGAYEDIVVLISEDGTMNEAAFAEEIEEVKAQTSSSFSGSVSDIVDFTIMKSLK